MVDYSIKFLDSKTFRKFNMDRVTVPILFEICSYLKFKEMVCLARMNKHYNVKMMDKILIIFSEREAQRLLFSK